MNKEVSWCLTVLLVSNSIHRQPVPFANIGMVLSAAFLQTRTFKGLEQRLGEDAPSVMEEGRSGIARGYGDDHRPGIE